MLPSHEQHVVDLSHSECLGLERMTWLDWAGCDGVAQSVAVGCCSELV